MAVLEHILPDYGFVQSQTRAYTGLGQCSESEWI